MQASVSPAAAPLNTCRQVLAPTATPLNTCSQVLAPQPHLSIHAASVALRMTLTYYECAILRVLIALQKQKLDRKVHADLAHSQRFFMCLIF